jgi:hypothetical protein
MLPMLKIQMDVVDAIAAVVVVDVVAVSQVLTVLMQPILMKAQIVQKMKTKIPQKVQLIAAAVAVVQLARV